MRHSNITLAACLLLGLVVFQPFHVSAATYDSTWFIFQEGDQQKRRFAEIQVTYTFPDNAKAGKPLEVDVSLTYVKNDKAFIAWLDFYNVGVHLRKSATGSNLASDEDSSRVKLKPGDQYTHKFTVTAPQDLDQYFVVLTWKTYNPLTTAYGLTINESEIKWDTGDDDPANLKKVTVGKAEIILTIKFENLQTGSIKIDGQNVTVVGGAVQLPLEGQHTIEVPALTALSEGARAVFDRWSDGDTSNPRRITLENDLELVAVYKTQYLLSLASDQGNPQGAGWYDAGSEATISVTSPQPDALGALGGRFIFQGWTGDVASDSPTTTVTMDGPKTVSAEWRTDDSQAYMILGGIAAAIVIIIAAIAVMRGRGKAVQEMAPPPPQVAPPIVSAPPPIPPPPTPAYPSRPPLIEGAKYCVHCGAVIPSVVLFCTKCGKKQ